ncbi:hypothetical protein BABINDRAFT_10552 [Babjeviella inositovora NRRL Y-12698]|uniref:Uncharacterized protein n=1 Tax=Babjeviella inositovora NRRL Y-12698 TaxID=984486 RepID=A0A1E3QH47_9ASCO|nr:uncharacterized protein BABINDRAFT_10552 [Babjeviella inositovora NRRL Y-12698]ODQ77019.1 hypothetical protein BABINDRAFT_10552 [Babjeviella inositovora NRRL Y-12698]
MFFPTIATLKFTAFAATVRYLGLVGAHKAPLSSPKVSLAFVATGLGAGLLYDYKKQEWQAYTEDRVKFLEKFREEVVVPGQKAHWEETKDLRSEVRL